MEDIISQGHERPPGGSRRRLLVAAALVVVVALLVVEHLPHGRQAPHPGGRYLAAGHETRQRSFGVRLAVHGRAVLPPGGIIGNVVPWTAYSRLPRAGTRPDWFWPATGRVAPIPGLPSDRFGFVFTRLGGGWAIQPRLAGSAGCIGCAPASPWPGPAGCGDCIGSPTPVYYLADRAQRAIGVSSASLVAPGAKGQMWLTTFAPGSDLNQAQGVAQLFDGSGATIGAPVTLPAGYGITQGTPRGLLLESLRLGGGIHTALLWSQATRKVTRTFDGVVAVSATQVAYEPPCGVTCPVHVVDLINGYEAVLALPVASIVTAGSFSPDGRYLALQVSVGNSLSGASNVQFEVASMPGGQPAVVPNTLVSSDELDGFGWPDNGDDFVTEFSFANQVQVALWPPGGPRLAVADIRPNQDPAALVVG